MKKLLLLLLLAVTQLTWAGNVSENEAMQKAQAFLSKLQKAAPQGMRLAAKSSQLTPSETAENYYVFNVGQANGYVIVSADDRTAAILGYADEGTFDKDNMPENMKAWLQGYADQLDYLAIHPEAEIARVQLDEHAAVVPLLTSSWDQGEPYNRLCPKDGTTNSVTGCVATAMAQVLYYYKYPEKTLKKIPGYTTSSRNFVIPAIPVTTFDWANMLDYYDGDEDEAAINAVATLMKVCGVVTKMDYTSTFSATVSSNLDILLKDYFDFDATTQHINRTSYRAKEWNNIIYHEIAEGRPVYYAGMSSDSGHAFIIDGYDKEGLFHVNWGWGGSSNGYFLLSILDPHNNSGIGATSSNDGYSFLQEALIGAKPNEGTVVEPSIRMTSYGINIIKSEYKKQNGKFAINFKSEMYNTTGETNVFDMGVGIYDTNDSLVYAKYNFSDTLANNFGWREVNMNAEVPALPNGHYITTVISRKHGTNKWYQNENTQNYFLSTTISGDTLRLKLPVVNLSGTIDLEGKLEVGSAITALFDIKNNGTLFNDILYLRLDGKELGGRHLDVDEGMNETLSMIFEPTEAGTKHLALGIKQWVREGEEWVNVFTEFLGRDIEIAEALPQELKLSNGKVTNAEKIGPNNFILNSDTAVIQLNVKNNGQNDYENAIRVRVFKKIGESNSYSNSFNVDATLSLSKGDSQNMTINVPNLSNGQYWFCVVYKTKGKFVDIDSGEQLNLYLYTVKVPERPNAIVTVKSDDRQQNAIYDLKGQRVTQPKKGGLYIINGKKVKR
jgi:hypothetical protein